MRYPVGLGAEVGDRPASVITGGLAVALMFSLTHSAARREDSSVPESVRTAYVFVASRRR